MSGSRYPQYKEAQAQWMGTVPAHWASNKLKYAATFLSGGTPNKSTLEYWDGDIPWASSKDLKRPAIADTEDHITERAVADGAAMIDAGDLMVVVRGMILAHTFPVTQALVPMAINQDLKGVRPHADWDRGYFAYLLRASSPETFRRLDEAGHGTKALRMDAWVGMEIPQPPVSEQVLIAKYLDRETARIDALVSEQERLIELLKEKRQAGISLAVTKGLNPDAPMKDSGIEWLAEIPRHWRVVQVKHLARSGGKTFTDGDWIEAPYITTDGVRLIQTGNIGIGAYKEQGFRYISEGTFDELGCTEVNPRDVLICRLDGPVGRACLAPDLGVRMITSVDNAILKVADDVHPDFVVALLSSVPWLSWIDALCRVGGGFRLRVSRSQLGELRVPLPPYDEQVAIANHLGSQAAVSEPLMAEAQRAIDLLQERRAALISAAVTGQIDVRDAVARSAA